MNIKLQNKYLKKEQADPEGGEDEQVVIEQNK